MNATAAVIVAAGASRRLGQPKQLLRVGGETLLERAVRMAKQAGCDPVVVVLGAEAERIRRECPLEDAEVLVIADWTEGMAAAIRAGVAAFRQRCQGLLLLIADQPAVSAEHLRGLVALGAQSASAAASEYAGRRGAPAYFPAATYAALLALRGDTGGRELLRDAPALPLKDGELDVDTPEDLHKLRKIFGE